MDLNLKKPMHLIALLGVIGSLALFIGYPLISIFSSTQIPPLYTPSMTLLQRLIMEISLLFTQFLFVFAGLIVVPLMWYKFVNKISLKEMFTRLQLRREGLSNALLWGFITVIIAFAITMTRGLLYMFFTKTDPSKFSNIPDLQQLFSIPSLYLYTYAYAAIIAVILGVLLAVVVVKTKNLYSAIFAHTLINIASLTLYFFGKSFGM
ncbi:MAG: hypothetical protein NTY91_00620 [Euryarchaeota archaeon]|nr:hypothetical protein [Euryarchaeota archaeon]